MGGRKLYELLQPFLLAHQIKIGRDGFFDLLSAHNLLIKRRKKAVYTTHSFHYFKKYPNLIRDFVPIRSNELWVSDITYWRVQDKFLYIHLITDAYSRKIVGYKLSKTLESKETIEALHMATKPLPKNRLKLIHHSDRGIQYCSYSYISVLKNHDISISMTENGDPLENAIAERINGIIKNEYLDCYEVYSYDEAKELLKEIVSLYNDERPHMSIGNNKPSDVHNDSRETKKLWKKYYLKQKDETVNVY
jgi:transposase InsO family protein